MTCLFAETQALSVRQICSLIKNRRINVPLHQIPEASSAATTALIAYCLLSNYNYVDERVQITE